MTRLCTLADAEAVAERAAREIVQHIERARAERGVAHLALSGGTTPERTYELLAEALEDWQRVEVWFADERCVGPEDAESNYRMAREKLLDRIAIGPGQVHRMEGELGPELGAERYAQALRSRVAPEERDAPGNGAPAPAAMTPSVEAKGGPPALDVVVLGIGPDGHVASLFPGAPTLQAGEEAVCLAVRNSPKPPPERITLSLAVLRAARRCMLLASSANKRAAVTGALAEPTALVPASLLRRERLTVIVDDAASPPPPAEQGI
jgi:6-phosphogluconolactonase